MVEVTAGRYILELLKGEGCEYMFGIPGGDSRAFYDDLYDFPEIKVILTKHEQGAGFMADGYARASGKIGACTSTVAPGATNMASGLLPAFVDGFPVLAISNNSPRHEFGRGAIQDSSGFPPRNFDLVKIFETVTKWTTLIPSLEKVEEITKRALNIALTGRKGPVHLSLPRDITKEILDTKIPSPGSYRPLRSPAGDPRDIQAAAELLVNAEAPTILSGGGVIQSNAAPELIALAELLSAPVATTVMGKGSFPEDHPLSIGVVGLWGHDTANTVLKHGVTDVLLAIGTIFAAVTTTNWVQDFGGNEIIQVDIDHREIGKNYPVKVGIIGDAKQVLMGLLEKTRDYLSKLKESELKRIKDVKADRVAQIEKLKGDLKYFDEPEMSSDAKPIKPQRAMKEIRRFLKRDAIFLADSGNNYAWAERYMQSYLPKTYVVDGLTHMGWSVNAVIGAKLGAPTKQVLDVCGDGSFQMTCKEVITASTYMIPAVWCIFDDGMFSIMMQAQKYGWGSYEPERYISTDLYDMDFLKFAEACHVYGERVEKAEDIQEALKNAFNSGKPAIVDIVTEGNEVPPGSFDRYRPVVKKYPQLRDRKLPHSKYPIKILKGEYYKYQ